MEKKIIIGAEEEIACPKCGNAFALFEGISRQTIDRYAEDFDRALDQRKKTLEVELSAEAKRRAERERGHDGLTRPCRMHARTWEAR